MSAVAAAATRPQSRVSSGNAELDEILQGGFLECSLNIITGAPGTGKTSLLQELVFHNAGGDRPILYLTTLSEPLVKMLRYLQSFAFFDPAKLGTQILYEDIGDALAEGGLPALTTRLRALIRDVGPKIVVIDSFKIIHDLCESRAQLRRCVAEVTGMLAAYQTTVFLVGEYTDEEARALPEFAIADGIVVLSRHEASSRDERRLRVSKLRGSGYREGLHGYRIDASGLSVFPRLVSPPLPPDYGTSLERVRTGVPGLDELLGGGLWRGSTTLLMGPAGSGKTTIGLQFAMQGVGLGEPSLYLNFQENPTQLQRALRALGHDPEDAQRRGLHTLYESPVELAIDRVVVQTSALLERYGIRRVVIDALGDLAGAASDEARVHDYVYALLQRFAVSQITSVLTLEPSAHPGSSGSFSYLSDNIISLARQRGVAAPRQISVDKARGSAQSLAAHELHLGPAGARVGVNLS